VQTLDPQITELARDLLWTTILVTAPVLLTGLVVGLAVSLFQALTSVQEQSLAQVPKMIAVMVVTLLLLAPCLGVLRDYTERVFGMLVSFGLS
jgi:flagellar biosynthetic protein FliQ